MQHTHQGLVNYKLLRYGVLTNKNEYIIHASDNIEAGYRAINLSGLLDEELKDVHTLKEKLLNEYYTKVQGR